MVEVEEAWRWMEMEMETSEWPAELVSPSTMEAGVDIKTTSLSLLDRQTGCMV